MGKEPWKRSYAVSQVAESFLRLRHKMIPYIYTANYRTHTEGEPICLPMYYRYDCHEAYEAKNQYIFAGQLLVCPITKPMDKRLNLASVNVWLPEGRWTDIFNGRSYVGGGWVTMHRDIDSIPVLAPEGAIIPMYRYDRTNDLSLSQPLEIHIYRGNGSFDLYDDDGESMDYADGKFAITRFTLEDKSDKLRLSITPPPVNNGLLPADREMYIKFCDISAEEIKVTLSDKPVVVEVPILPLKKESKEEVKSAILTRVQGSNDRKTSLYKRKYPSYVLSALSELESIEY
jgi:alpha-glucosidase (family GH31 glycosyl hydrolase)